ncbi:protein CHUP1, chloroplastic-like isoform X1 [Asparagus officinalis]|nr:protein CHUP1, chloroplastic-like isoform X1 [Asparagus officinalis]
MDYPESMSQYEFEEEESSEEENDEAKEENEVEEEKPQTSIHLSENMRQISIERINEGSSTEEQIEGVRCQVAPLADRQSVLESQFYDYCSVKEQESTFQKLQIMCLGLKLESLESRNQRLEDTIAELREAVENVDVMRADIKLLQKKAKKLTKENKECSKLIQQYVPKFEAKEEISRSNENLHLATKEIKEVADQLHKEIKRIELKLETRASEFQIEDITSFASTKLSEQLQQLRDQWSADMEELIYLWWINASLRREIFVVQEEEENDDDNDHDDDRVEEREKGKPVANLGDEVVMELPHDEHVENCTVECYGTKCVSPVRDTKDSCIGMIKAMSPERSSKKPRLLSKLKGWAAGNGRCKRVGGKGRRAEGWPCSSS